MTSASLVRGLGWAMAFFLSFPATVPFHRRQLLISRRKLYEIDSIASKMTTIAQGTAWSFAGNLTNCRRKPGIILSFSQVQSGSQDVYRLDSVRTSHRPHQQLMGLGAPGFLDVAEVDLVATFDESQGGGQVGAPDHDARRDSAHEHFQLAHFAVRKTF